MQYEAARVKTYDESDDTYTSKTDNDTVSLKSEEQKRVHITYQKRSMCVYTHERSDVSALS